MPWMSFNYCSRYPRKDGPRSCAAKYKFVQIADARFEQDLIWKRALACWQQLRMEQQIVQSPQADVSWPSRSIKLFSKLSSMPKIIFHALGDRPGVRRFVYPRRHAVAVTHTYP
jgi:hypothetical protein